MINEQKEFMADVFFCGLSDLHRFDMKLVAQQMRPQNTFIFQS